MCRTKHPRQGPWGGLGRPCASDCLANLHQTLSRASVAADEMCPACGIGCGKDSELFFDYGDRDLLSRSGLRADHASPRSESSQAAATGDRATIASKRRPDWCTPRRNDMKLVWHG